MSSLPKNRSLRGSLLLLLGSVIWGAAFVAQRAGMENVGPFTFSAARMLLGAAIMTPVARLLENRDRKAGNPPPERRTQRKAGLLCGVFLFAATSLHQVGLVSTTAGKSGFITALYVVLVPVAGWLIFRRNPGRTVWLGVAVAVAALYLLCLPEGGLELQGGDLLVLGCAVCFTGQILCIDRYARQISGARLARDEFLITGLLSLPAALLTETVTVEGIRNALVPILYTGIMSSAVGYTLQIFGQRDTNPTLASILMCLESVFAVLTGVVLLGESMTGREIAGCVLMFSAVILTQLSPVISRLRPSGKAGTV